MSADELLSIGTLAATTGVAVSALRYYDEQGLVTPVTRVGNTRQFDLASVGRVNFIRRAQRAGFSLAEVKDVLAGSGAEGQALLARKIGDLRRQRAELDKTLAMLEEIRTCGCDVVAFCPAIEDPC